MTDSQKLDFLLRSIVLSGGPSQTNGMTDEAYMAELIRWLIYYSQSPFYSPKTQVADAISTNPCQCKTSDCK